jgi:hypothetical protein
MYTMGDCHLLFQSEKGLRKRCTQAYASCALEGYETKSRRLVQKWSDYGEEIGESEATRLTDEERRDERQIASDAQRPEE